MLRYSVGMGNINRKGLKMSIGTKLGGGLMIAAGAFFCFAAAKMFIQDMPAAKKSMSQAVYVGSSGYDAANDGKVVVVTGTYKLKNPAYDDELNIYINAARAIRNGVYAHIDRKDMPAISVVSDPQYVEWKTDWNADGNFVGEADVGEYHLAEDFLSALTTATTYSGYDEESLARVGLGSVYDSNYAQGYFVQWKEDIDSLYEEGERRYYYSVPNFVDGQKITVIARQDGGFLHNAEGLTGTVLEGELSEDEVMKTIDKENVFVSIFAVVFSLGILFGGVAVFRLR